jgi:hypothetical protein
MSLVEEEDSVDEFDPEVQVDVDGLIHLGALFDTVEFCGHTFGIRTLRLGEELSAARVVAPFRNTLKEPEAWASAQVALALTSVDGDEDFCPQAGPDQDAYAQARFRYLGKNWFWPTVEYIYNDFTRLQQRQIVAIRALQDLSARNRPTSWPSVDSLSALGISTGATDLEIHDLPS